MTNARYLGDAVYASYDGYGVMLTTGHHEPHKASNRIVLEPEIIEAFISYVATLKESLAAGDFTREQI